jgi:hypothetical protein
VIVMKAIAHQEHCPRHWHDALAVIARGDLDWDYLVRRARRHGARRVASLLLYAQSNDHFVPTSALVALLEDLLPLNPPAPPAVVDSVATHPAPALPRPVGLAEERTL